MSADAHHPESSQSPEPSDELLERYLAGRCTAEEAEAVERWLAGDAEREAARNAVRRGLSTAPRFDAEAMLRGTLARIERAERRGARGGKATPFMGPLRAWRAPAALAAAAVLVLAVGLAVIGRRSRDARPSVVATEPMREVVTKRGQQAALNLADGSRVTLAPESRLRIPANYNVRGPSGTRRELYLEGKAFFVVQHDSTRPFVVHTATAITEDVGTEFVVSAYPESHATRVAVVSGAVAMRRPHPSDSSSRALHRREGAPQASRAAPLMVVAAGDVARLDTAGAATLAHAAQIASYASWTTGVLAFDGEPLGDALAELGRWYDVDFRLQDRTLDNVRITGEFRNDSLDRMLQRLALMLGVRVTRSGGSVLLSPTRTRRAS